MDDLVKTTLTALGLDINPHTLAVATGILSSTPYALQIKREVEHSTRPPGGISHQSKKPATTAPASNVSADWNEASPGAQLYVGLKIPKIKEANPTATAAEVTEIARQRWRDLDDETRARFEAKALKQNLLHRASRAPVPIGVDAVLVLNAMIALRVFDKALAAQLASGMSSAIPRLQAPALAQLFHSFAQVDVHDPSILDLMCKHAVEKVDSFSIADMAHVVTTLVKFDIKKHALLQQFLFLIPGILQKSEALWTDCASLMVGLSRLGVRDSQIAKLLVDYAMGKFDSTAVPLHYSSLTNMLYSAAKVKAVSNDHLTVALRLIKAAPPNSLSYTMITMMWYVISVARTDTSIDPFAEDLLSHFFRLTQPFLHTASMQHIVAMWFAISEQKGTPEMAQTLLKRSLQCVESGEGVSLENASTILFCGTKMGLSQHKDWQPILRYVANGSYDNISTRTIRNLLSAFGTLHIDEFHILEKLARVAPRVMYTATEGQVAGSLMGLTRLAIAPKKPWTNDPLAGSVLERTFQLVPTLSMKSCWIVSAACIAYRDHPKTRSVVIPLAARFVELFPEGRTPENGELFHWGKFLAVFRATLSPKGSPHALVKKMAEQIPAVIDKLQAWSFSNLIYSMSTYGLTEHPHYKLLVDATPRLIPSLASPVQCSQVCAAAGDIKNIVRLVTNRVVELHAQGRPVEWTSGSNILAAMSRTKVLNATCQNQIIEQLTSNLKAAHHNQLCSTLSSLSRMTCHNAQGLDTLWEHFLGQMDLSTAQDFTTALQGRATTCRTLDSSATPLSQKQATLLSKRALKLCPAMTPKEAATVAWALAYLRCDHREVFEALYRRIGKEYTKGSFEAARLLWTLAHTPMTDAAHHELVGCCLYTVEGSPLDPIAVVWALDGIVTLISNSRNVARYTVVLEILARKMCDIDWKHALPDTLIQAMRTVVAMENGRMQPGLSTDDYTKVFDNIFTKLSVDAHRVPMFILEVLIREIKAMYITHITALNKSAVAIEGLTKQIEQTKKGKRFSVEVDKLYAA